MDIYVLDTSFTRVALIDNYSSLIWTDRYRSCGDFELYISIANIDLQVVTQNCYLQIESMEHTMIIEQISIDTDVESGVFVTLTGRSLESILKRRIVWGTATFSDSLQQSITNLLNTNIIAATEVARIIPNFVIAQSTNSEITSITISAQYTGAVVSDVIESVCQYTGLGFKIVLSEDLKFIFSLYKGMDRSYAQEIVPYVVFSTEFENVISSRYLESGSNYNNVALIGGEGEGSDRRYSAVAIEDAQGLNRRELFVDARDISSEEDGYTIADTEYLELLEQRGIEKISEHTNILSFDGEVDMLNSVFKYGTDFFIGDLIQITDSYGHSTTSRISEIVTTHDQNGVSTYPTLEAI